MPFFLPTIQLVYIFSKLILHSRFFKDVMFIIIILLVFYDKKFVLLGYLHKIKLKRRNIELKFNTF